MNNQQSQRLLLLGMLAALLGVVADHLLLYSPGAVYERFDYAFLLEIPPERLAAGHYLGILAIPFELLGLWALLQPLKKQWPLSTHIAFFCTILVLVWGVAYHASVVWMAALLRKGENISEYVQLADPLAGLLVLLFFLLSIVFGILSFSKKSPYGVLMRWGNPIFSYTIFILLYIFFPRIGRHIIVAGFNLSIFFFLLFNYLSSTKNK